MESQETIKAAIASMLMDERNEQHGLVYDAEARFGSTAFDNGFSRVTLSELRQMLTEYADDHEKGHGGIKDFLGTVDEYAAMPASISLAQRMRQAAIRALNDYNDSKDH